VEGPVAGTISYSGGTTICTGTSKDLILSGHSGSIQWQSSSDNSTWTDVSGATAPSFNTGNLATATYFRAKLSSGSCTPVYSSSQLITLDALSVAGTISGSTSVCPDATSTLTLSGYTGTIVWTSAPTIGASYVSVGVATASYTTPAIATAGYFKAQVTNGTCPAVTTSAYTVSATPLGNIATSITGPGSVTLGGTATYSVPSVTNATSYVWNLPAGMSITSNSNGGATIVVSVANNCLGGTISVQAVGCTNSSVITKSIYAIPSTSTLTIATTALGAPIICGGTSATFTTSTTSPTATATYLWTLPSGVTLASGSTLTGSSITVDFATGYSGGSLSVTRASSTESLSANYTVGALAIPANLNGPTSLCGSTTATYTVASVNNATGYEWSLPSGMTITSGTGTIMIGTSWSGSVSGTVQVRALGACGNSAWRSISVASMATPGAISGPTVICGASSNTISASGTSSTPVTSATYSIAAVSGASTYTWSVPTGMTIVGSATGTSINVTITPSSFVSGQVTVIANGTTGCTSATRTLDVYKAVNAMTGLSNIPSSVSSVVYSVPNVSGYTYSWTVPTGMSIASGSGTNSITVSVTHPLCYSGTVSCVIGTACGNTTVSKTVQTSNITSVLASYNNATQGYYSNVTVAPVSGATGYKFKLESSLGTTVYAESSNHVLPLYTVPNFTYGVSYDISVAIKTLSTTYDDNGYGCSITLNTPTTTIQTASCGSTVGYYSNILANLQGPNTGYKFKLVEGSNTIEVTSTNHVLSTSTIPGFKYGVTYAVSVAIKNAAGVYGAYGASCNISTTAPTIQTASCGSTVGYYSNILANPLGPNTGYMFKLVPSTGGAAIEVTTSNHVLSTYNIPNFIYGITYSVSVCVKNSAGEYGGYGASCNISTTAPTISTASCGSTVGYYSNILANPLGPNSGYKFKLVPSTGGAAIEVTSTNHVLPTYNIPNFIYGITYSVSVSVKNAAGVYGGYGASCDVSTTAPTISSASCNATVGYYANILADPLGPNSGYKFKLVNGSTIIEVESTNHVLPVYSISQIQPLTAYEVSVCVKNAQGQFGGYGQACTVTTGAFTVTTSLATSSCGTTVNDLTAVNINPIAGAAAYMLEFTGPSPATAVYTATFEATPTTSSFAIGEMTWMTGNPSTATTLPTGMYNVKVKFTYDTEQAYSIAGAACNLTYNLPQGMVEQGPQQSNDASDELQTAEPTTATANEASTIEITATSSKWQAIVTANPFDLNFAVKLSGVEALEATAMWNIRVLDMSGKVLEQGDFTKEELMSANYGEGLASGVYMVHIAQGNEQRMLRVVKR
jgi:hypothetical protein